MIEISYETIIILMLVSLIVGMVVGASMARPNVYR
jgi:hypothetical protein